MIMPIRAFDDNGNADVFTLAKAIRWATQHHAQVINMSFGARDNTSVMREAVAYAQKQGVILVASAGNDNTATAQYPAAYPGVITVAATTLADQKASFSNYGSSVDVDAPGVDIISAYPGGGYAMASGTSFSAPEVAGEVALILQLKTTGIGTTVEGGHSQYRQQEPFVRRQVGYGRVDALRAVQSR
jgi:subtilisin family serine protease